jgi:hypothetical protein
MKLVGVNPTESQSTLIKSLQDYLIKKGEPHLEERLEISRGIFRRLPNFIAQESDLRTLETITDAAYDILHQFSKTKEDISHTDFKVISPNNNSLTNSDLLLGSALNGTSEMITIPDFFIFESVRLLNLFEFPTSKLWTNISFPL